MRAEQADVVIVGAGLAGSAAARALASRGRSVVLVEAFQPGHRRGSSHGSARIFRRAYPDPLYVRLTGQAQVLWRQLADEAGVGVAAGAWLEPLLGGQVPLPPLAVTQEEAFHFAQRPPAGAWPTFIYYGDVVMYGLPAGRDGEVPGAVKIGLHHGGGRLTTGDDRDEIVRAEARERAGGFVRDPVPGLDPAPGGEGTCPCPSA